ncbi:MAG TPA: hypothetical protein VEF06_01215 [Bryobacteraceae bacterium]|nr:hypothetical protein [Bryobacteraceae bacterium]
MLQIPACRKSTRKRGGITSVFFCTAILSIALAVTSAAQTPAPSKAIPRTPDGHPDLQGIWTNATMTPLERPPQFAGKATLTDEEALAFEKQAIANIDADRRGRDVEQDLACAAAADPPPECGWHLARVHGAKRTSLIIDPPDGRVPPFRAEARQQAALRMQPFNRFDSIEDRPLPERCLVGFGTGAGPPMMPGYYNNNYQIVQTPDYVMILAEMVHDVRIIRIGGTHGQNHLPPSVRQWFGDSVGHWEGDTLVVDTTNFSGKTPFHGSSANLHVIERFTRTGEKTFLYTATIDDPETFSRPWTLQYPFLATPGPIFEDACHEGNLYTVIDILGGARKAESQSGGR